MTMAPMASVLPQRIIGWGGGMVVIVRCARWMRWDAWNAGHRSLIMLSGHCVLGLIFVMVAGRVRWRHVRGALCVRTKQAVTMRECCSAFMHMR